MHILIEKEVSPMLPNVLHSKDKSLLTAFGAGVVCALLLPKAFFCFIGASLLLATGISLVLDQKQHNKEC